jgi:hypothetical protein
MVRGHIMPATCFSISGQAGVICCSGKRMKYIASGIHMIINIGNVRDTARKNWFEFSHF